MAIVITDDTHYQDIAEKIRELTNDTSTFKPADMVQGIIEVSNCAYEDGYSEGSSKGYKEGYELGRGDGYSTGLEQGKQAEYDAFWDALQKNGNRDTYSYVFAGSAWTDELLERIKYPLKPLNNGTVNYHYMFHYNTAMTKTPVLCVGNTEQLSGTFNQCISLTEIYFEGEWKASFDVNVSPLSVECLRRILNGLKDFSGTSKTMTLRLGTTNLAKLSDAEKAVATQKGWTLT